MNDCEGITDIKKHKLEFVSVDYYKDRLIECSKCRRRWYHDDAVNI